MTGNENVSITTLEHRMEQYQVAQAAMIHAIAELARVDPLFASRLTDLRVSDLEVLAAHPVKVSIALTKLARPLPLAFKLGAGNIEDFLLDETDEVANQWLAVSNRLSEIPG